ncbi:glycoside hydrolase family 51 protein [Aureobasidium subglaciale EXF-2481]|uniref:non-reducing end alpha-L-arabinofuranosidase n=1 Tax=Aureobasidium subglaciale (strain EXF-2481) TaxID=1043005 RepID=A0A074Y8F4_AURSE|nr:glycoside hydrolase family 51 protein [Aureobasidium subglaciale EXF-2481]KAI5193609.1 putative vacuolar segregation protein [Aureobasidium subglaciale]KAI5213295.1 putative vacuolar segregation protein [Aureobasidium subglaciale]KAI5214651.1 putative vacuolar segregation protein [Aureobasidium subglaciale]KAI5252697.1 putative vacuolar segregation protein [Aureobasidium subglaciale]KEQ92264.1 glycoside hydrolase family 51 protein [Aureobasidium subglaciale EXF-2481]
MLLYGVALAALISSANALDLTVASSGGNATSPLQYGLMFEDINFSGDGGIYAELIRNRAFQGNTVHPSSLLAYGSVGGTTLSLKNLSQPISSALPTSMNVATGNATSDEVGFSNTGYWGIGVEKQDYTGSFWVKGAYDGSFTTSLKSDFTNETFATAQVVSASSPDEWVQHNFTLTPASAAPSSNNSFYLTFDKSGVSGDSLDFTLISLFPPTYKNRPNGLRKDIAEALKELNPKFLRFPGGNNLEGDDPPYLWYWNETIGPLKDRPGRPGTWGYQNTDGLGLIEYLHWCEDLELEPILAVWDGFYLSGPVTPQDELGVWIQFALDELEFLMGSTSTTYGALRASLGYPEPFQINYVEIGNEDNLGGGNASYSAYRLPMFTSAIKAVYPDMTIIGSTPTVDPIPEHISLDYHEYSRPDNFVEEFNLFDHYNRSHPILIGEYAVIEPNNATMASVDWTSGATRLAFPSWTGSVAEAVFLLGAERNSDFIIGASYAPTLQNLNSYQWTPDMISFTADPTKDVLSTSWHMLQLLGNHIMTETLPVSGGKFGPAYYVAGYNNQTGSHILKTAVYKATADVPVSVSFKGVTAGTTATLTVLTAPSGDSYNAVGAQVVQSTNTSIKASAGGVFKFELPKLSVSVLEVHGRATYWAGSWGGHRGAWGHGGFGGWTPSFGGWGSWKGTGHNKRELRQGYKEIVL